MTVKLKHAAALMFFFYVLCIIPLYFQNMYFDMLEAKRNAYFLLAGILLPVTLALFLAGLRSWKPSVSPLDLFILAFGIWALLSALCSDAPGEAFWGSNAWHIGAFTILSLAVFYLMLSRWLPYSRKMWIPVMAVCAVIFILGILFPAGVDVFDMHRNILQGYEYIYYSTLGNSNWINGYLCLLLSVILVFYLGSKQSAWKWLCLIVLALGICMMPLCSSDGIFPGLGLCAFFAVPYVLRDRKRIGRLGVLMAIFGAVLLAVAYMPCFGDKRYYLDGAWWVMMQPQISVPMLTLGILLALACRFGHWELKPGTRRVLIILAEVALAAVTAAAILWTLKTYSDDWGSQRGYIWNNSIRIYRALPLGKKLLGVGPEMLPYYYGGMVTDRQVATAHSEPIQILLTMGVVGLLLWVVVWVCVVTGYFKNRLWRKEQIAFYLALTAYLGQSLVNSAMTTNAVLLCVFAALFRVTASWEKSVPE